MSAQARVGLITTTLALIGGVWLFLAPFIVEYQEVGEEWIGATRNDMWAGGVLIAVSALTIFLFIALALRDAAARADKRRLEAEEDPRTEQQ